ncbi:Asparagine--tRNA ligase [Diplonema papillatum]|nr:Asparagine--tRNA ligase [Diplonema papillatum]
MAGRLSKIGLDDVNIKNITKNEELTKNIILLLDALKVNECQKQTGHMLYSAVQAPEQHRVKLGEFILSGKLQNSKQCDAAVKYLKDLKDKPFDEKAFSESCGAGVVIPKEQIQAEVATAVAKAKADITAQRYKYNQGRMLGELRKVPSMRWADGEMVKEEIEKQIGALLGPKTAEDEALDQQKPKDKKAPAKPKEKQVFDPSTQTASQKALIADVMGYKPVLLKDIPQHEGKEVVVRGWAHVMRAQKGVSFVVLRDGTSYMQCVVKGCPDVPRESTFAFRGTVVKEEKAAKSAEGCLPYELKVSEWAVIGLSHSDIENLINKDSDIHQLLQQRHMYLRRSTQAMVQKVRSYAMKAFRDHFFEKGCMEVQPPTMVQTQCEGGSTLFNLDFYGEKAYLTQSSQLYLETAIPMIGDCFCILPSYRAEKSLTKRHLSEFTHIEAEYPFITFDDLLTRLEDLVIGVLEKMMQWCGDEIKTLNPGPMKDWTDDGTDSWKQCYIPKRPFKRITHADAIKLCREHNIYKDKDTQTHFEADDDIPDAPERQMIAKIGEPAFMVNFPTVMKSFYMKKVEGKPELTESVDLLMPGIGEIIGGSMRISDFDELMAGYAREGLDPEPYYWFTDQRKYGTTPHGGFGLGLERFLVWLCNNQATDNVDHVREICLFPRLMGRCTP